jgi:hypothetical protein
MVGYLSGVGSWTTDLDPLKEVDTQAVWAWMNNCWRAQPLIKIIDAGAAFVREP